MSSWTDSVPSSPTFNGQDSCPGIATPMERCSVPPVCAPVLTGKPDDGTYLAEPDAMFGTDPSPESKFTDRAPQLPLDQLTVIPPQSLISKVQISSVLLPYSGHYAFHVFRCGSYAAIVDFGVFSKDFEDCLEIQIFLPRLLRGVTEIELFLTHLYKGHYGLLFGTCSHVSNGDVIDPASLEYEWNSFVLWLKRTISQNVTITSGHLCLGCDPVCANANYSKKMFFDQGSKSAPSKDSDFFEVWSKDVLIEDEKYSLGVKVIVPPLCDDRNKESLLIEFSVPVHGEAELFRVLFTGDIDSRVFQCDLDVEVRTVLGEEMKPFLIQDHISAVDVVVLSHLGSPENCSFDLFQVIPFDVALIPSGTFNHNHYLRDRGPVVLSRLLKAVQSRYLKTGVCAFRTDQVHCILTDSDQTKDFTFTADGIDDLLKDQLLRALRLYLDLINDSYLTDIVCDFVNSVFESIDSPVDLRSMKDFFHVESSSFSKFKPHFAIAWRSDCREPVPFLKSFLEQVLFAQSGKLAPLDFSKSLNCWIADFSEVCNCPHVDNVLINVTSVSQTETVELFSLGFAKRGEFSRTFQKVKDRTGIFLNCLTSIRYPIFDVSDLSSHADLPRPSLRAPFGGSDIEKMGVSLCSLVSEVQITAVLLPCSKHYAFHVFRCGNYAAIVDFGLHCDLDVKSLEEGLESLLCDVTEVELFLTHLHKDHYGFLFEGATVSDTSDCSWDDLMKNLFQTEVSECVRSRKIFYTSGLMEFPDEFAGSMRSEYLIENIKNTPLQKWSRTVNIGERDLYIKILVPPLRETRCNAESLVIEFSIPFLDAASGKKDFKVLFTGDMDFKEMKPFLESSDLSPVDVVVIPHHGSPHNCTLDFFKAFPFDVALVPSGTISGNHFHLENGLTVLTRLFDAAHRRRGQGAFSKDLYYFVTNSEPYPDLPTEPFTISRIIELLQRRIQVSVEEAFGIETRDSDTKPNWFDGFLTAITQSLRGYADIDTIPEFPKAAKTLFKTFSRLRKPFPDALMFLLSLVSRFSLDSSFRDDYSLFQRAKSLSDCDAMVYVVSIPQPGEGTCSFFKTTFPQRGELEYCLDTGRKMTCKYHFSDYPSLPVVDPNFDLVLRSRELDYGRFVMLEDYSDPELNSFCICYFYASIHRPDVNYSVELHDQFFTYLSDNKYAHHRAKSPSKDHMRDHLLDFLDSLARQQNPDS